MDASAAKFIGAGLAAIGMIGAGIGVGNIFGQFLAGALRNPSAAAGQVGNLFVGAALAEAHRQGAKTIFLACVSNTRLDSTVDIVIRPVTGPEVITGSTRMKAGTATKLVLNTITTGAMIKLGRVYGNLMIDLLATNNKLADRAERIVMEVTGLGRGATRDLLKKAHGQVKTALLMHLQKLYYKAARKRLLLHEGFLHKAINAD